MAVPLGTAVPGDIEGLKTLTMSTTAANIQHMKKDKATVLMVGTRWDCHAFDKIAPIQSFTVTTSVLLDMQKNSNNLSGSLKQFIVPVAT